MSHRSPGGAPPLTGSIRGRSATLPCWLNTPEPEPTATLEPVAEPLPGDHEAATGEELGSSLGWQPDEIDSTMLWATISLLIGLAGWALARWWRRGAAYALIAPLLVLALFGCFLQAWPLTDILLGHQLPLPI